MKKNVPVLIPALFLVLLAVFVWIRPSNFAEFSEELAQAVVLPDQQLALALIETEGTQELFAIIPENPAVKLQITQTEGKIIDFSASPDGERIVYTLVADTGASQLWEFFREAGFSKLIKECGEFLCSEPAYSAAGDWLAYTKTINRKPQVWLLNLNDGSERTLLDDLDPGSEMPLWSPDGSKVAVWNAEDSLIEIVEIASGETWQFGNVSGDRGSWGPNSDAIYFQDTIPGETSYSNGVRRVDLETGERTPVACTCKDESGNAYLHPVVNPIDGRMTVGVQAIPLVATRELWLMNPEGEFIAAISEDLSVLTTRVVWAPDGERLLFTRNEFPIEDPAAELMLWDPQNGSQRLAENVIGKPGWLSAVD